MQLLRGAMSNLNLLIRQFERKVKAVQEFVLMLNLCSWDELSVIMMIFRCMRE